MSNNGRLKVIPAVFVAILKDDSVLLLRRANTSWMDGYYDLPAGHLEDQEPLKEGALRELKEETGLEANAEDLKLVHVHQNHHRPEAPHYGYIFLASKWKGDPKVMEKDKCDDMAFFAIDALPDKITPYVKVALEELGSIGVSFSYHPPGSIKQ
jgi:8-oxo-dGTP diphosphatase